MSSRWLRWSILAVAGALGPLACTLLGDFRATQCAKDRDCDAIAPGQELVCDPSNHVCVRPAQPTAQAASSTSGGAGAGGSGGAAACTTNEECTARSGDLPAICEPKSGLCVELRTDDCPLVYGDWLEPNVVVFGAFAFLLDDAPNATPAALNIHLAVDEINLAGGVPIGPDGVHHKLVAVVCSKEHPENVIPNAKHLVEQLGVSAILGQAETAELKPLVDQEAVPHDVLVLATLANDASLTTAAFKDQGLLWHGIGDMVTVAPAFGAALALAEDRVKAAADAGAADIKVALIESQSFETQQLVAALKPHLHYNGGKDIQANGANFVEVPVDSIYEKPNADYAPAIGKLTGEAPDVIIVASGDEFGLELLPKVEANWNSGHARPFYVACPLQRYNDFIATKYGGYSATAVRTRFIGVDFSGDAGLYAEYAGRYTLAFPAAIADGFNYAYDATYALAYALASAGKVSRSPGGSDLAKGLSKLSAGQDVVVGTSAPAPTQSFAQGLELLESEGHIRLIGTTGPFALDPVTGSREMGASLYCIKPGPDAVNLFQLYAQSYNETTGQLEPVVDCF